MTDAYYNENDPKAAAWLRELIRHDLIAPGVVDERSICDVDAADVAGYIQCHFFAGIGGWSLALRLAGWPDDRPVWTGSCPCQPFSAAGKRRGTADERHLWPEFRRLIAECQPATVFGEQVASKDGREWLAGVRADLEALGYGVGAADLCAAGVGAPHIRQRLFWLADAVRPGWAERRAIAGSGSSAGSGASGRLAFADGWVESDGHLQRSRQHGQQPQDRRVGGMGNASGEGLEGRRVSGGGRAGERSPWPAGDDAYWLPCTDGKARRVEPGSFPLANGVPARVGRLRGYGNAIVPQVAAEFIQACFA